MGLVMGLVMGLGSRPVRRAVQRDAEHRASGGTRRVGFRVPPVTIPRHVGSRFPFPRQEGTRSRCRGIADFSRPPEGTGNATRRAALRGRRRRCPTLVMTGITAGRAPCRATTQDRPTYRGIVKGGTGSTEGRDKLSTGGVATRLWCDAPRRGPLLPGEQFLSGETGQYLGPLV